MRKGVDFRGRSVGARSLRGACVLGGGARSARVVSWQDAGVAWSRVPWGNSLGAMHGAWACRVPGFNMDRSQG